MIQLAIAFLTVFSMAFFVVAIYDFINDSKYKHENCDVSFKNDLDKITHTAFISGFLFGLATTVLAMVIYIVVIGELK